MKIIDATTFIYVISYLNKDSNDFMDYTSDLTRYIDNIVAKDEPYYAFLDESSSFRKSFYPEYKNRPKTYVKFKNDLMHYAKKHLGFSSYDGYEADDLVCLAAELYPEATLVHGDKDLLQIPGNHLYFNKQTKTYDEKTITKEEAFYNLALQVLQGDSTDNIKGLPGIGPVKAKELLKSYEGYLSVPGLVNIYINHHKNILKGIEEFHKNYRLVKLLNFDDIQEDNKRNAVREFLKNSIADARTDSEPELSW